MANYEFTVISNDFKVKNPKEVGNEKLIYNIGVADVITKRTTKFFDLDSLVEKYIKELDLEICL